MSLLPLLLPQGLDRTVTPFMSACLTTTFPHSAACPPCAWLLQQIELPKLSLDKFTDSYFKAAEDKQKGKKGEDEFFKKGEGNSRALPGVGVEGSGRGRV